jgi:hypothetical protein
MVTRVALVYAFGSLLALSDDLEHELAGALDGTPRPLQELADGPLGRPGRLVDRVANGNCCQDESRGSESCDQSHAAATMGLAAATLASLSLGSFFGLTTHGPGP